MSGVPVGVKVRAVDPCSATLVTAVEAIDVVVPAPEDCVSGLAGDVPDGTGEALTLEVEIANVSVGRSVPIRVGAAAFVELANVTRIEVVSENGTGSALGVIEASGAENAVDSSDRRVEFGDKTEVGKAGGFAAEIDNAVVEAFVGLNFAPVRIVVFEFESGLS